MTAATNPTPTELATRYLAQTRIVDNPEAINSLLTQQYQRSFVDILTRLDVAPAGQPSLFVAYTPEAQVETVTFGDAEVVIYDQHLGQAFNRLNDFSLASWPHDHVIKWGFRHLGHSLASLSSTVAASLCLALAEYLPTPDRPKVAPKQRQRRLLTTAIQEYFVLAHECGHSALRRSTTSIGGDHLEDVIDAAVKRREARGFDLNRLHEAMLEDELRAIEAHGIEADDALVEKMRARIRRVPIFKPTSALTDHAHLREELQCDLIATQLTVTYMEENGISKMITLPAILHALHNLNSIEVIRDLGRVHAKPERKSDYADGLALRKTLWRELVPSVYASGAEVELLGGKLTEITVQYAHAVGDHFLYMLPYKFEVALAKHGNKSADTKARQVTDIIRKNNETQRTALAA
ncbi:MAG: hypothetical protein WDZ46_02070 [Solirubrobacterales bacterium]